MLFVLYRSYSYKVCHLKMCPKFQSEDSALEKSFRDIRKALKEGRPQLRFCRFHQSPSAKTKCKKHHHAFHMEENERLVINEDVIKVLARQFKQDNRLQHIHLGLCSIKDSGLIEFLEGNWNNLIELDLYQNKLSILSIDKLVRPTNLASLKQLRLNGNQLDSHAAEILIKGQWKYLQELNLDFNNLGDKGVKILSKHKWNKLKQLYLLKNNIHNQGLSGIVSMNIPCLQGLYLAYNEITDDGCKILSRGRWRLKYLQLQGNKIQDDGLFYLTKLPCFNLISLKIVASRIYINNTQETVFVPSLSGITQLLKGCWNRLTIQISLGKMGPINIQNFMLSNRVKDMLELKNVVISMTFK